MGTRAKSILTCIHKSALNWRDGAQRVLSSETKSLSRYDFRKHSVRTVEPRNIPKNKTTQGLIRVVLLFPLQSLHPRQGWECSNCSEVLTWWFYFIYPLATEHHHYIAMPHWPSPREASWEVAAILCKLTPVTHFT